MSLPAGWSVAASPELRPIGAPWLTARTTGSSEWKVAMEIPRGRFEAGTEQQRLADLNAVAALFRQPFLLEVPEPACGLADVAAAVVAHVEDERIGPGDLVEPRFSH